MIRETQDPLALADLLVHPDQPDLVVPLALRVRLVQQDLLARMGMMGLLAQLVLLAQLGLVVLPAQPVRQQVLVHQQPQLGRLE